MTADVAGRMSAGLRRWRGWPLWLRWVLASTAGLAMGRPVSMAVGSSRNLIVAGAAGVAIGGIVAGVLQWLVLRRRVTGAGRWVLASTHRLGRGRGRIGECVLGRVR